MLKISLTIVFIITQLINNNIIINTKVNSFLTRLQVVPIFPQE